MTYKAIMCPGQDSNLHAVSSTTTSKWLVYQFQHPGTFNWDANVIVLLNIAAGVTGNFGTKKYYKAGTLKCV